MPLLKLLWKFEISFCHDMHFFFSREGLIPIHTTDVRMLYFADLHMFMIFMNIKKTNAN